MISVSAILEPLVQFWFLIPIILFVAFFKSPVGKGIVGEFLVNASLDLKLDKDKYHLIKNVVLPTKNGTTQIDHIVVSEYGIFVVETKNMKGWIFGNENENYWTQKIYKYTNRFQNPLFQNYKHIKVLQNLLGIEQDKIFSVIVFSGESEFKTKMPENVRQGLGYIDYIKSKTQKILTKDEVSKIISQIDSRRVANSLRTHQEHVKHVKSIIDNKNKQCP